MNVNKSKKEISATVNKANSGDKKIESKEQEKKSVKVSNSPKGTTKSTSCKTHKSGESRGMQESKSGISMITSNVIKSNKEISATTDRVKSEIKKIESKAEEGTSTKLSNTTKETKALKGGASNKAIENQEPQANVTKSKKKISTAPDKEGGSIVLSNEENMEEATEDGSLENGSCNKENGKELKSTIRLVMAPILLIEQAHGKAKDVLDNGFHLVISQAILFFQNSNCEIEKDLAEKCIEGDCDISTLFDCSVERELQNIDKEFAITLGIAIYGFLVSIIVIGHALRFRECGDSPIDGLYKWTDRIPIIDSLLEIPISLWLAPFVTIFLWSMFVACCVGLVVLTVSYDGAEFENGNTSTFALTAFLVGFDIYRMTGNISQYYVLNKSAKADARRKEEIIQNVSARSSGFNVSSRSIDFTRVASVEHV